MGASLVKNGKESACKAGDLGSVSDQEEPLMDTGTHSSIHVCVCVLSRVRLFVTPWTVAARLLCLWNFASKNIGVGCYFLLQGIFLTQELNPSLLCLLCCRKILYLLSHQENQNRNLKCSSQVSEQ